MRGKSLLKTKDMLIPERMPDRLLRRLEDKRMPWGITIRGIEIGGRVYPPMGQKKWEELSAKIFGEG